MDPGRDAYRGFEYQIQVSAWIALRFLGELQAPEVVVEPLGGEDLQALNALSADTSEQAVGLGTVDYLVQVKARGTGSWEGRTSI